MARDVEALAIALDGKMQFVVAARVRHGHVAGVRVFEHVGQALVRHAVERRFALVVESLVVHVQRQRLGGEVATALGISVKTAEGYRANGLEKLKLRTRSDVLRYALAQGWLADEGAFG